MKLELWGGVECTVNRVQGRYHDQNERTGHAARLDDIDRIASLGVKAVRYPILWERTAPDGLGSARWDWIDARLERLRALGIRVIAGLVHHGSGPPSTHLLDPSFVEGLAAFAGAVARRYPWIEAYTPVNEPLTTARFSALYGFWYPHHRDAESFYRALFVETMATVEAMRAIREVSPQAKLVQTEDMGRVGSSSPLRYQARYENHRRFLSLDLLFGRVGRRHPLHEHLVDSGVDARALEALVVAPCPPDIIGANYYVTSDRFLDHRLDRYPLHAHGGNGRQSYADVDAVRARRGGIAGHEEMLISVWERYRAPIAITEAHLGGTPEEQARWLMEAWRGAKRARERGVDVRAVTVWSIFGAYDWDSLVTTERGHYEPGAFDVRGPEVRPTVIAWMAKHLARSAREPKHPVLQQPGWWRRPERLTHLATGRGWSAPRAEKGHDVIVITGPLGRLGRALVAACEERRLPYRTLALDERGGAGGGAEEDLRGTRPWLVIHAGGPLELPSAGHKVELFESKSSSRARSVIRWASRSGARLILFSSAHVFDGEKEGAYLEGDSLRPINVLGRAQAQMEASARMQHPSPLLIRAGLLVSADDECARWVGRLAISGEEERVLSLSHVPELAHRALDLGVDHAHGVYHVVNAGEIATAELARRAGAAPADRGRRFTHPLGRHAVLGSSKTSLLGPIDDILCRWGGQ